MKISSYCIQLFFTVGLNSFTIRDFYLPTNGYTEAKFYTLNRQFRKTVQTRTIRYIAEGREKVIGYYVLETGLRKRDFSVKILSFNVLTCLTVCSE